MEHNLTESHSPYGLTIAGLRAHQNYNLSISSKAWALVLRSCCDTMLFFAGAFPLPVCDVLSGYMLLL
jgi:hypothetical protein